MSSHGDNPPTPSSSVAPWTPVLRGRLPQGQPIQPTPPPSAPNHLHFNLQQFQSALKNLTASTSSPQGLLHCLDSTDATPFRAKLVQLVKDWNRAHPDIPVGFPGLSRPSTEEMAVDPTPAPAPTPAPTQPTPAPATGSVPSYAAAAVSSMPAQPSATPAPQGINVAPTPPSGPAKRPAPLKKAPEPKPAPVDPLARVAKLAAAFPKAPASQLIQLARDMGPVYNPVKAGPQRPPTSNKPSVKHAPKGAMNTITVALSGGVQPPQLIPHDGTMRAMFSRWLTAHPPPQASDMDGLSVEFVRWMPPTSFRVRFNKRPPPSIDPIFKAFVLEQLTAPSPTGPPAEATSARFQFKNTIFFRRVPLQAPDGTDITPDTLLGELRTDSHWSSVDITSRPRLHVPKSARGYGVLYVDFADNARGSTLKDVLRRSVILNGESCWAQAARSANDYTVPRCTTCQKWGHRANHCRSIYRRCAHCSGLHDERDHTSKAPCCSGDGTGSGPCLHPPTCTNCRGVHRADSKECGFYRHRTDFPWIKAHQPTSRKVQAKGSTPVPTTRRSTNPLPSRKGKEKAGTSADEAMEVV